MFSKALVTNEESN